ncbi:hypothetical protein WN943_015189 [Citrus x changshan-huyou]
MATRSNLTVSTISSQPSRELGVAKSAFKEAETDSVHWTLFNYDLIRDEESNWHSHRMKILLLSENQLIST